MIKAGETILEASSRTLNRLVCRLVAARFALFHNLASANEAPLNKIWLIVSRTGLRLPGQSWRSQTAFNRMTQLIWKLDVCCLAKTSCRDKS